MPRSGTLVICVQNLDFSGANQVILNIVAGKIHESNVVILSPKSGAFATRFVEYGAAMRIGDMEELLQSVRDVFCIICNTIMTANIIVQMANRKIPTIWILHEWWDDEMLIVELAKRNYKDLTLQTVKQAMATATRVVCVCESQRQLYNPLAPSSVIYVGVPDPIANRRGSSIGDFLESELPQFNMNYEPVFTFLCLGIICPRKNQLWTVELFKKFAVNKPNVRLQIVGARYTRQYEIEYLEKVKAEIGDDKRIEVFDVTDNVDQFYREADCVMLTSLNEVTPMVIVEALSRGIPVISTNIAGIREIFQDGVEGYMFEPGDENTALRAMETLYNNDELRKDFGLCARNRFETMFDLNAMVESYRTLVLTVAPPIILLDMDGTLIDWDKTFYKKWQNRCPVHRSSSYFMEKCVDPKFEKEAEELIREKGFFASLEWMEGASQAVAEMEQDGFQLFIVTSPLRHSRYCAQEKIDWIRKHLGEKWVDKVILCNDKTKVAGDLLIDDKPYPSIVTRKTFSNANWRQIIFDAPYNRDQHIPRLNKWSDWRKVVYPMLGRLNSSELTEIFELSRSCSEDTGEFKEISIVEQL